VRQVNPEVPAWLERIIAKLHAKDPAGRFQSASEVADLLGRCLAHVQQPLTVALPAELTPPETGRATRRRTWRWVAIAAGLAVLLAGTLMLGAWRSNQTHVEKGRIASPLPTVSDGYSDSLTAHSGPDEIAQEIQAAWVRVQAIEADMHRPPACPDYDPLSALAQRVAAQAASLEREIVPGRDTINATPTAPHILNLEKRR
jgi:serine/threonine-protein kinase